MLRIFKNITNSNYWQQHLLSVLADLAEYAVFYDIGLATDFLVSEFAEQIGSVWEDVETAAHTVFCGYFLVYQEVIDLAALPHIIMGQDLYAGESKSGEEALV